MYIVGQRVWVGSGFNGKDRIHFTIEKVGRQTKIASDRKYFLRAPGGYTCTRRLYELHPEYDMPVIR